MKPSINRNLSLCLVAAGVIISQLPVRAGDFHVATAQELQNALTLAAASSVSNNIYVTNGYYTGNFNYNSSNVNNLTILAEPGAASTQIVIDSGGTGSSMSLSGSATANITVQGMTFLRNCGSTSLGGLRIAGGNTAILVSGCRFLSPTNSSGIGLLLVSGINATVTNCIAAGSKIGGGGTGIYISGITSNVTVQNCTMTTNTGAIDVGGGLYVSGAGVVAVNGSLFGGNSASTSHDGPGGGGAFCSGTTVLLSGNTFTGNSASTSNYQVSGGGAYCSGTTVTLSGNTFTGNSARNNGSWGGGGGGAFCLGIVTLSQNTFTSNSATGGACGGGACFWGATAATLFNNTFTGNSASHGGGVSSGTGVSLYNSVYGPVTLTNNTFTSNSAGNFPGYSIATGYGGGAYLPSESVFAPSGAVPITVSGNTFQQNTAVSGGGLYASGPTINLLDNLVVKNSVTNTSARGGGIWVGASATLNMINNTVSGNTSAGRGGRGLRGHRRGGVIECL